VTGTAATGASGGGGARRPPVLLMHALMQDSEAFLCGGEHSLALFLADQGFDVWLGA
jgi:pimeloyl-ACP methyl ester carboxylesterase